jgi:hypothetical protein
VLEDLCCGAWCGSDLSDGGVEEMLSLRCLLPESLAESEAVDEARPPRRVTRISGRPLFVTECVLKLLWIGGIDGCALAVRG